MGVWKVLFDGVMKICGWLICCVVGLVGGVLGLVGSLVVGSVCVVMIVNSIVSIENFLLECDFVEWIGLY